MSRLGLFRVESEHETIVAIISPGAENDKVALFERAIAAGSACKVPVSGYPRAC